MKYKITIIIEGENELKNDLEKGFIESAISRDVFYNENVVEFQFEKLPE